MSEVPFDEFELTEELSRRGMVSTLRCRTEDGATVILKLFESPTESDRLRITKRAAALEALDHPGLARARGTVDDGDDLALVYDWVGGETVAEMIERGVRFTDAQLFECMRQILEALEHAHDRDPPVIHRDVKPQNIVWTGERFVLIDFDSAREVFADSGTASVVGTTGYAGPEQFVGSSEPRSDQYGLAATVLHMATHRHPTDFPLAGLRIDLSKTTLSVPMRRLLGRMLEPQVERRFDTVSDAIDAVSTEDGLEPWEVAMEPLRDIEGVVEATRDVDGLRIDIASRSSATKWFWYALLAFFLAVGAYIGPQIAQFAAQAYGASGVVVFGALPVQMMGFLFAIYLGSRSRQEYRSRAPATVRLSEDGWRLELPKRTISGRGPMNVRSTGHSSAKSTGGVTPISIREELVVEHQGTEHQFAHGLLPVEATAVVETIRAFQEQQRDETGEVIFASVDIGADEASVDSENAASVEARAHRRS